MPDVTMLDTLDAEEPSPDHAESVKQSLSRNVTVDVAARVGYLITRFFIPPFVLAHVSLEAYGLWSTAFIVVSYVGLSTMGISSVYIKFIAEYTARREYRKANELLSTGLCLTIPFCFAVFLAFYLAWPRIIPWLHIATGLQADASEVVLSVVAIFLASLSLGAFHDAVVGAQQTDQVQKRWVVCYLVETVLIFVLVGMGRGIRGLSEAFLVRTVVDVALCLVMAVRLLPWLKISWRLVTREALHNLFSFGAVVQIQGLLSVALNSIERAISAPLVGLVGTALLDIGKKLPAMAGSVPLAFASSFTPAASYLHGGLEGSPDQRDALRRLYLRGARYMNLSSAYFCGLLVAAPGAIIDVWMGKHYQGAAYLVVIFSISIQVHLMTGPGTSILKGMGKPKEEFHYSLANVLVLLVAVPLSHRLLGEWTGAGVATAVAISTVISASYFIWHANRLLQVPFREYFAVVVAPGLVPYAVAAPFAFPAYIAVTHLSRWAAMGWITTIGVLYSLALAYVVDRYVWGAEERIWFRGLMASRFGHFFPSKADSEAPLMKTASLSDYFPATYVINLPERGDRRKVITGELARAGMPLCAGKVEIFPAVKPKKAMGFPSAGVRGCLLSHLGILTKATERNLANVLIVEDDLILSPKIQQHLERLIEQLRGTNWGMVYLGHIEKVPDLAVPQLVAFTAPLVTSHFYAVNGPVIPRLIHFLEQVQTRQAGDPLGGPMHLDGALTMFRQANRDVLTLIAQPNLGWQRPSRSNINCRWYERLPVVRHAADLARSVRERLRAA